MSSRGIFRSLVCAVRGHDWHLRDYNGHRWGNVNSCRCARCADERPHAGVLLERSDDSECRKCSWCGATERHDGVPVALSPGHSPCVKSAEVCSRCGWRREYVRHAFTLWEYHGSTTEAGAWREHRCEVCGVEEQQEYVMCGQCKGTGVCPRCKGRCCDPWGRTCDLCCGEGDCNCKRSNWYRRTVAPNSRPPSGVCGPS